MSWQLSTIWSWPRGNTEIRPLGMFLPIGLYGETPAYRSLLKLTASARRIHSSLLNIAVDYVSGRKTIFWGSLGRNVNVCSRPIRWYSTTHTFQLCGCHPIHGRDARIYSHGLKRSRGSLVAHTL
jgi:hypothetical protein